MKPAIRIVVGFLALTVASFPVRGDPPGDYQALFGEEEAQALASKNPQAISAFAAKILEAGKSLSDSPAVQVLIYQKAYEMGGRHRTGHATALAALQALQALQPEKNTQWEEMRLALLELQYKEGDLAGRKAAAGEYLDALVALADSHARGGEPGKALEVYRKAMPVAMAAQSPRLGEVLARHRELSAELAEIERRQGRIKRLSDRLKDDPKDSVARQELILLYFVELGNLAQARKLLTDEIDPKFRENMEQLGKTPGDMPEAAALAMAEWLRGLSGKAKGPAAVKLLVRARPYYQSFLERHTQKDAVALKARIALSEADKLLEEQNVWLLPSGVLMAMTFDSETLYRKGGKDYVKDITGRGSDGEIDRAKPARGVAGECLLVEQEACVLIPGMRRQFAGLSQFTISLWYKRKSAKAAALHVFDIGFYGGSSVTFIGRGAFCMLNEQYDAKSEVSVGPWHHAAFGYDGTSQVLYLDGVLQFNKPRPALGLGGIGDQPCRLGNQAKRVGTEGAYFEGWIDELIMYNRGLAEKEIQQLYRMGSRGGSLTCVNFKQAVVAP